MSSSGGGSSSMPRIMVFRPTMEEFKDFPKYIEKIESRGAHRAGLAKIIPPEGWCPRKNGYDDVNIVIPSPISQVVNGRQGLYQQFNIQKKAMTVKEFQKLAECSKYKTPQHFDYEDLERKYWKNITYNPPIYGADVSGSLYSDGVKEFNIQKLNTILDMVKEGYEIQIEGVNTAYLYFGMWKTTFAWHTEDMDLYSINYLHFGAPKSWYAIPPEHGRRLERLAAGFFHGSYNSCQAFLRHKMTIISPQILKQYSIPYNKITQEPGEFMITFPFGYHSGFNHGFNCAESTNFATERWIEYGKRTISCTCRNDCVKICMDMFVRKFQPDKYEKWLNGKDMGTHPEDPSKHSAAPAPNKLELAIAAQRERKRAKHIENTSKIKRHPISKTGKNGEKYKIQSATNDTLENSNDGDSKETEIYDVDEAIQNKPSGKKNQAKREASPITPKKQTKESDQDLIEHDRKDTSKTSNTFKDTIIKQEKNMYAEKKSTIAAIENVPDNPPDLKPFWDQETKKSKKMDSSVSSNEKNVIKTENTEIFSKFPHLKHAVTNGALAITTVKLESPKSVHSQSSTPNSNQSKAEFSTLNSARKLQRDQSFSPSLTNKTIAVPFCSSPTSISKDIPNEYCSVVLRNWSNSGNWKCEHTQGLKVKFVQPKPFSNPMITQPISSEGDSPKINQLGHLTTASGVNSGISITPLPSPMQVEHSKTSSSKQSKKSKRGSKKNQDNQPCSSSDNIKPADDCLDNWAGPISKLWQHRPLDFEAECNFNMHCSTIKPHCAVCSIFSSANISVTFPTEQPEVPSYSKVKMPAFCFANGVDNQCILDTNPLLARDGSAPLITCSNCKVSVHATCYGVTMLQMGPWLCTRCANHAENAECCLCVLRGGALKPTNDGRWAHITCAILIPETCFENIVFKEPINVSRLTAVRQRLKCKYCFKSSPVQNNAGGACIQCLSGKCYMPFHVTCGHMAGVIYEANDWPEPINIVCTRHASARRKPVKRQFTNIDVGDTVLAKHKNRRYYSVRVKEKFLQEYYSVLFDDNSTSTNTLPEDIVKRESTLIGRPELDEKIQVKWTDEKIYNGLFKGFNCCETYVVEFDDGTVLSQERHQIYATDEFIPKEIKSKWSHSTESRHVGLFTAETEGKRLRISNTKYKSFTS